MDPIAEILQDARRDAGFDGFVYDDIVSVLRSVYAFDPALAEVEKRDVLGKGINRAAEAGRITSSSLDASIRRAEQETLRMPLKSFVLASNLSFVLAGEIRPSRVMGHITLSRYLPQAFLDARASGLPELPEEDRFVSDYSAVRVNVRARSQAHAVDLAMNRMELLRSLWNFAHARNTLWASTSDPTTPISRVRFGRIHTLHSPGGALATTTYWFNSDYRRERFPQLTSGHWQRMQRFLRSAQQRFPKIKYRGDLQRALVHYSRALDSTEMEAAFLKLWSILELLVGLGGERYDDLIARTAFLYKPEPITKYVLEHLRYQRNEIAHLGSPQSELRPLVYQLKRYVDRLLGVHLAMGRHFEDLEEAGRFLSLHERPQTLRRRTQLIQLALRFRRA